MIGFIYVFVWENNNAYKSAHGVSRWSRSKFSIIREKHLTVHQIKASRDMVSNVVLYSLCLLNSTLHFVVGVSMSILVAFSMEYSCVRQIHDPIVWHNTYIGREMTTICCDNDGLGSFQFWAQKH